MRYVFTLYENHCYFHKVRQYCQIVFNSLFLYDFKKGVIIMNEEQHLQDTMIDLKYLRQELQDAVEIFLPEMQKGKLLSKNTADRIASLMTRVVDKQNELLSTEAFEGDQEIRTIADAEAAIQEWKERLAEAKRMEEITNSMQNLLSLVQNGLNEIKNSKNGKNVSKEMLEKYAFYQQFLENAQKNGGKIDLNLPGMQMGNIMAAASQPAERKDTVSQSSSPTQKSSSAPEAKESSSHSAAPEEAEPEPVANHKPVQAAASANTPKKTEPLPSNPTSMESIESYVSKWLPPENQEKSASNTTRAEETNTYSANNFPPAMTGNEPVKNTASSDSDLFESFGLFFRRNLSPIDRT